jgi:hypothetical protein
VTTRLRGLFGQWRQQLASCSPLPSTFRLIGASGGVVTEGFNSVLPQPLSRAIVEQIVVLLEAAQPLAWREAVRAHGAADWYACVNVRLQALTRWPWWKSRVRIL